MNIPRYTPREVGCPYCGATPGNPCVTKVGGPAMQHHRERVAHARAINERIVSDYWVRMRAERRGGPPRTPKPCGTRAAAMRHLRRGEPLDAACDAARKAWERERSRRRRAA